MKDLKGKVAILTRLNRIQLGNLGDWKPLSKGVCELRIQHGPGYRIYFGREDEKKIIILCGGDKKTQKQNIRKAQECWADWRGET